MRPNNVARLALVAHEVPITLRLHEDDPILDEYKKLDLPEAWDMYVGPSCACGGTWQWAFKRFPNEEFYGFIGDDCVPITPEWDKRLAEAAGRNKIAYPNDGIWNGELCTHPCIGGDLVRAAGFWAYPSLQHNFIDTVWQTIGEELDLLVYCDDVLYDHRHVINEKADMDAVYMIGQNLFPSDEATFYTEFKPELASIIVQIKEKLGEGITSGDTDSE